MLSCVNGCFSWAKDNGTEGNYCFPPLTMINIMSMLMIMILKIIMIRIMREREGGREEQGTHTYIVWFNLLPINIFLLIYFLGLYSSYYNDATPMQTYPSLHILFYILNPASSYAQNHI